MSKRIGRGNPPAATRFQKGRSGNPSGRPKNRKKIEPSPFDILASPDLVIVENGVQREVTIEEALHQKICEKAFTGNKKACRQVMNMIVEREKVLQSRGGRHSPFELLIEPTDPCNALEAMVLPEVVKHSAERSATNPAVSFHLLETWTAQAALERRGLQQLTVSSKALIMAWTRDSQTLQWPKKLLP